MASTTQSKISVLHIVTRMNTGGVAVLVSELVSKIESERFEQHLITGSCSPEEEDYLKTRELKLGEIIIPSMSRALSPVKDLISFFKIIKHLRIIKPDIVHTHTSKAGVLGRIATKIALPKAKIVHTFHGQLLRGYFSRNATWALIFVERILARVSDLLIAMGNEVKANLIQAKIGSTDQYVVSFPGVDKKQPNLQNSQALQFKSEQTRKVVFTFVGRLSPIKRCDRILELAKSDAILDSLVHFLIIGDGELREKLEIASFGLPITFIGWQSNIEDWLAISDVAILLSSNEAVPLAMIEAGHAHLPVIATNVGSMSDVVFDGVNGYLVEENLNAIADRVLSLAHDKEKRQRFGSKGAQIASERFSVNAMVLAHQEIYSRLMNRAR